MEYSQNYNKLKDLILSNESFLLSTHVNPDADALGSELAFANILQKLGKKVHVVNHNETPYNLEFLDPDKLIIKSDPSVNLKNIFEVDVVVLLDLNHISRIKSLEESVRNFKGTKICIDHHQYPEAGFDYLFGGIDYCATGEIIFDLIERTKIVEFDLKISELIYAAIMTDTGSFRFERTTSKVHRNIATLLETGVNPTIIYDNIFNTFHFGRVKLLGNALSSIKMDESKKIAYMVITSEDLKNTETSEADVEGFVNFCLTINNVQIAILFYELNDGVKISFRSKGSLPVNKLAGEFQGGGHISAAGARLYNVSLEKVIPNVISEAQKYL